MKTNETLQCLVMAIFAPQTIYALSIDQGCDVAWQTRNRVQGLEDKLAGFAWLALLIAVVCSAAQCALWALNTRRNWVVWLVFGLCLPGLAQAVLIMQAVRDQSKS